MENQYNKLFFGIIITSVLINFGFEGSILRSVGYIIVSSAIFNLYEITQNECFKKAKLISSFFVIIYILRLTMLTEGIDIFKIIIYEDITTNIIVTLDFILFYLVFAGTIQIIESRNLNSIFIMMSKRLRFYIVFSIITIIIFNLSSVFVQIAFVLEPLIMYFFGVIRIFLLFNILKLKKALI